MIKREVPAGTLEWRQGKKWVILPPPYNKEDMEYLDYPIEGTHKFATGKGSAAKTMQVLGGNPPEDVDVDLGWAKVHISREGNEPVIEFTGGKEAIEKRWAEEKTEQSEIDQARAERGVSLAETPYGLEKTELPQYRSGKLRVYLVNGEYIRSEIDPDWTQGGHYKVYPKYINQNEIWIERMRDPIENQFTILHEITELNKMNEGLSYDDAHSNFANVVEAKARDNPAMLDSLIQQELVKYRNGTQPPKLKRETAPVVSRYNEEDYRDEEAEDEFGEERKSVLKSAVSLVRKPRKKKVSSDLGGARYYLNHRLPDADLGGTL